MSTVSVRRLRGFSETPESLLEEIEILQDTVRKTAEQFFRARSGSEGTAVDDWVRAERQVFWAPQVELKETATAIHLLIGVPGLRPEQIEVTLLPEQVILAGASVSSDACGQVHFSEFGTGKLFRRILLPSQIHVDSAVVILDKSMLKLSAVKIEPPEELTGSTASQR